MADKVEKVPAETRWAIAAQSLTGATMATQKALLDAVGQEKYNEIVEQNWDAAGKASKQIADALGLAASDAKAAAETVDVVATVAMGPEFKLETVEATAERAVVRTTECPWWNRAKEFGLSDDFCAADPAWHNGLVKSFNPKLSVTLTKAMMRGDPYCEWVYELQK